MSPGCLATGHRIVSIRRMRNGASRYFFAQIARAFMPFGLSLVEKQ